MCVQETIHISIVSHGHGSLVSSLLENFEGYCRNVRIYVTVTLNIPESVCFDPQRFTFPIEIKCNPTPKGFAANHNEVFWEGQRKHPCPQGESILSQLQHTFKQLSSILDIPA